jgi:hypothetical protein
LTVSSIIQKSTATCTDISIRVHAYPHPQHIKVLKQIIYIKYGSGMQSEVVYSLNHDLTASLVLDRTLNIPKIHLHLHRYQHKGAPISPSTAYKGAETHYIYIIWKWDAE